MMFILFFVIFFIRFFYTFLLKNIYSLVFWTGIYYKYLKCNLLKWMKYIKLCIRIYYSWCVHLVTVLYRTKLDASLSNGHFIIFTYEIFSITVLSFIAFCFLVVVDKIKKLGVYMLTRKKSFFYGHKISLVFLLLKLSIILCTFSSHFSPQK